MVGILEFLTLIVFLQNMCGTCQGMFNGPDVVHLTLREGDDVVLPCSFGSSSIQTQLFDWKKDGQKEVFLYDNTVVYSDQRYGQDPQFKGRVSHYPGELVSGNASIRIRDTKVKDSGNYTCDFPRHQPSRRSRVSLVVEFYFKDRSVEIPGVCPKPYITTLDVTNTMAKLRCEVHGASPKPRLQWMDGAGNVLAAEEPQVKETGGRHDIIIQTTVNKTDHYRCIASQEEFHHQTGPSETFIYISGVCPKPYITTLDVTNTMAKLRCEVHGASPKARLQWMDGAGNVLAAEEPQVKETGGRHDIIIIQTTVNKTGRYQCVAIQGEFHHDSKISETFVYISGYQTGPWITVGGVILAEVMIVAGIYILYKYFRNSCGDHRNQLPITVGEREICVPSSPPPA